jgi:hypothetical protein
MEFSFLTPIAGLVALVAVFAVVAFVRSEQRAREVRALLRLAPPPGSARWTIAAIAVLALLVGVGAAQPVIEESQEEAARSDAQAFFVIDTSRSMLASTGAGEATRFDRARAAALRIRDGIPQVPAGIASLTDRVLPHVFPTVNRATFESTLRLSIGVDRPPAIEAGNQRATSFGALVALPSRNFFRGPARRLLVVLTDAETTDFEALPLSRSFARARIDTIVVRVSQPGERIYTREGVEAAYRPDPASGEAAAALARAVDGRAFDEDELDGAIDAARSAIGRGRTVVRTERPDIRPLGQYAFLAALLPLGFLLWRRNLAY